MKYSILFLLSLAIANYGLAQGVGIGTTSPATSAALEIKSSNGALLIPRLTTTQRNALTPTPGMMIYNNEIDKFQGYSAAVYQPILRIDTTFPTGGRIISPDFTVYQSFTAPGTTNITAIQIVTNATSDIPGNFEILFGDGIAGSSFYAQPVTYTSCGNGNKCVTQINFTTPFHISGTFHYTLKFSATSGSFAVWGNGNAYAGGQMYQNSTSLPGEDMFLRVLVGGGPDWVDLH